MNITLSILFMRHEPKSLQVVADNGFWIQSAYVFDVFGEHLITVVLFNSQGFDDDNFPLDPVFLPMDGLQSGSQRNTGDIAFDRNTSWNSIYYEEYARPPVGFVVGLQRIAETYGINIVHYFADGNTDEFEIECAWMFDNATSILLKNCVGSAYRLGLKGEIDTSDERVMACICRFLKLGNQLKIEKNGVPRSLNVLKKLRRFWSRPAISFERQIYARLFSEPNEWAALKITTGGD